MKEALARRWPSSQTLSAEAPVGQLEAEEGRQQGKDHRSFPGPRRACWTRYTRRLHLLGKLFHHMDRHGDFIIKGAQKIPIAQNSVFLTSQEPVVHFTICSTHEYYKL